MKKITTFIFVGIILSLANFTNAQCTYYEFDKTTGTYPITDATALPKWSNSAWYNSIDIDFEKITDAALPQHNGADGRATTSNWGTGYFLTPVYTQNETGVKTATGLNWPVKYYLSAFAPNFNGSAYEKIVNNGITASGNGSTCYMNDNSMAPSEIYNKKGFIELSRQSGTTFSKHGYIQIDSIPACERIQWSFSTTSWKRGFKADINYHDGKGWIPQRWMPSDLGSGQLVGFGERGYMYEEMIGLEADPSALISFRVRIWDGDSIHINPMKTDGSVFSAVNTPLAQKQVVRVHQIKIFTGVVPEVAPTPVAPQSLYIISGVKNTVYNGITSRLQNKNIIISEIIPVLLYSIEGKEMYKGITDRIDVNNYTKGIYILQTTNSSGIINTKKIIL